MAKAPARKSTTRAGKAIDPAAYAAFIRQIELKEIWLGDTTIAGISGPGHPEEAAVEVNSSARYVNFKGGFLVYQQYQVRITAPSAFEADEELPEEDEATLDVTFELTFWSSLPMTDEVFAVFREVNLPVNTWPYLREFVANIMGRMGWHPVALPAFKRGIDTNGSATAAKARHAQRAQPAAGEAT